MAMEIENRRGNKRTKMKNRNKIFTL